MLNLTRFVLWFAAVASLLVSSTSSGAPPRIPVVLSTDVGNEIDDQWTIVYLLTSTLL